MLIFSFIVSLYLVLHFLGLNLNIFECYTQPEQPGQPDLFFLSCIAFNSLPSYPNPEKDKLSIFKDNSQKTGVYQWTHISTQRVYIGSGVDLTNRLKSYFSKRILERTLSKGKSKICSALLYYGLSGFKLDILEYCDKGVLIEREQYYINKLEPSFNILTRAGSSLGFKHSTQTKNLLRNINSGRTLSEETKLRIKKSNLKSIPVKILNNVSMVEKVFPTLTQGCAWMGISPTHFNYHQGKQPIKGIYTILNLGGVKLPLLSQESAPIAKENAKAVPICVTNIQSNLSVYFPSIVKTGEYLGVTKSYVSRCIKLGKPCKGYLVKISKNHKTNK